MKGNDTVKLSREPDAEGVVECKIEIVEGQVNLFFDIPGVGLFGYAPHDPIAFCERIKSVYQETRRGRN